MFDIPCIIRLNTALPISQLSDMHKPLKIVNTFERCFNEMLFSINILKGTLCQPRFFCAVMSIYLSTKRFSFVKMLCWGCFTNLLNYYAGNTTD